MFYEPKPIKSEIRNLKQSRPEGYTQDIFTYDIYFDDELHSSHNSYYLDREAAINEAKQTGTFIRERLLIERELAAVGKTRYIKFNTDLSPRTKKQLKVEGIYEIYLKGKHYCGYFLTLEEAQEHLCKLQLEDDILRFNFHKR